MAGVTVTQRAAGAAGGFRQRVTYGPAWVVSICALYVVFVVCPCLQCDCVSLSVSVCISVSR